LLSLSTSRFSFSSVSLVSILLSFIFVIFPLI
jgi:hypothetical protein